MSEIMDAQVPYRACIASVLADSLDGKVPRGELPRGTDGFEVEFKAGLLRWATEDRPRTLIQWRLVETERRERFKDRDDFVEKLWQTILDGPNRDALDEIIEGSWGARAHYQERLFLWFLQRFDLAAARRMLSPRAVAAPLHWLFSITTLLLVGLIWRFTGLAPGHGVDPAAATAFGLAGGGLLLAALWLASGLDAWFFAESLIPRLAATVAIGYLFLANATDLILLLHDFGSTGSGNCGALRSWGVSLVLLGGATVYTAMHIRRRVQPSPHGRRLWERALSIIGLAVAYAAYGVLLFAPVLVRAAETSSSGGPPARVGGHELVLCAAVALSLGVVLQLAWEEKPLTAPL